MLTSESWDFVIRVDMSMKYFVGFYWKYPVGTSNLLETWNSV